MSKITVYAGDASSLNQTGDTAEAGDYRLITGIKGKNHLVENLSAGSTFYYRVKGLYIDGTESRWSKSQCVTLFGNSHAYIVGDVNHDNGVDINDVTALISYVLGNNIDNFCPICASVNSDNQIDINDVTALISFVLGGSWPEN